MHKDRLICSFDRMFGRLLKEPFFFGNPVRVKFNRQNHTEYGLDASERTLRP